MFLGSVDKFEPVFSGGEMDHAGEAIGELVIPCCDGTVALEMAKHTLNPVSFFVKVSVVVDRHLAI